MNALVEERILLQLLDSLGEVSSSEDLLTWVQKDLQQALPHRAFLCGFGRTHRAGITFAKMYTWNLPIDYLRLQKQADGQYVCPVIKQWLASGEVQLVEPGREASARIDPAWRARFIDSGLNNIAAYGMHDFSRHYASYFSFYRIAEPLGAHHRSLLRLFGPALHAALLRILHAIKARSTAARNGRELTARELEVLAWVCEGKTSAEIASILGIAQSTVRNQIQSILVKLRVNTRAQAAAKAIKKGLVVSRHPDSVFGNS
ncbi:MAG: LuxR C-terminal-related transcriptional regulator [Gammaproteobacteria bacterium]